MKKSPNLIAQEQGNSSEESLSKELEKALGKALIVAFAWQTSGLLRKEASAPN